MRRFQTTLEPRRISGDGAGVRVELCAHPDHLCVSGGTHGIERAGQHPWHVDCADLQTHLAAGNARQVQQVVDELHLNVRIADDRIFGARDKRLVAELSALQHSRPAVHRVERRAQLVREDSHELLLGAIGGLCRLTGLALLAQQTLALSRSTRAAVRRENTFTFERICQPEAFGTPAIDDALNRVGQASAEVLLVSPRARHTRAAGVHDRDHPVAGDLLTCQHVTNGVGLYQRGQDVSHTAIAKHRRAHREEPVLAGVPCQAADGRPLG
jgi:hypothetical protein